MKEKAGLFLEPTSKGRGYLHFTAGDWSFGVGTFWPTLSNTRQAEFGLSPEREEQIGATATWKVLSDLRVILLTT